MSIESTYEFLSLVPQELILVTAPKIARGEGGTKVISISFISISCLFTGALRDVMAPEFARGVPLPVYMNLDVYSGFWCTSHCVVF